MAVSPNGHRLAHSELHKMLDWVFCESENSKMREIVAYYFTGDHREKYVE